jgi:hypothetical protein
MSVRRGPAIVLSLVLGAAALAGAPGALASDGETAKDVDSCQGSSTYKLKVTLLDGNSSRLQVVGAVFSSDDDVWSWKLRHDGDLSAAGEVRARDDIDRSFRVSRTMINFDGNDNVVFRAENNRSGEVCKGEVSF